MKLLHMMEGKDYGQSVMGKSQSRLGFKSRFEHFWGVIRQFKDSIRQPRIGI